MNILITGIGGPTPRSIAKTIRKNFPYYKLIGIDSNPKAIGFYINNLLDNYKLSPKATDPDYWNFIQNLIEREKIDLAFVQPEKEVIAWGRYYKTYKKYPCKVLIPPIELSEIMVDKSKMADALRNTKFIPRTINISQENPKFREVEKIIGFPCWIRAATGSGGFGSLKILDLNMYKNWLLINSTINDFTISEFLPGRHLANQMLYFEGNYYSGASLECVEYVMANVAPSRVTGNTSFGRFLNEHRILEFCHECIKYISEKTGVEPHGVFSFDLKEDKLGQLKVTEINARHMAYTGIMADIGFNLISDTINILMGNKDKVIRTPFYEFNDSYIFLRDVDIEPIILKEYELTI